MTFPCHIIPKTKTPEQVSSSGVALYEEPGWRVFADYVEYMPGLGLSLEEWLCLGYRVVTTANRGAIPTGFLLLPMPIAKPQFR